MKQFVKLTICVLLILLVAELSAAQKPELVVQTGHSSAVQAVAFSPDGKLIASGAIDGSISLWDAQNRRELRKIDLRQLHYMDVWFNSLAFSPDGKTLASGGGSFLFLWDVKTGLELMKHTEGSFSNVASVSFSPDGALLATGGSSSFLWEVATWRKVKALGADEVAFSPDGKILISAGGMLKNDRVQFAIRFLDGRSGDEIKTIYEQSSPISAVAFSPDGSLLAFGTENEIKLWDVVNNQELKTFEGHTRVVTSIAFSPDGKTLVSGGYDEAIKFWEIASGKELKSIKDYSYVNSIAVSPDGETVVTGNATASIGMWSTAAGQNIGTLQGLPGIQGFVLSPDGRTLATHSWGRIKLWDLDKGTEPKPFTVPGDVGRIVFSPDGTLLASSIFKDPDNPDNPDDTIILWDVVSGAKLRVIRGANSSSEIIFSPNGKVLANGGFGDGIIKLFEVATGQKLKEIRGNSNDSLAFSRDGKLLAVGNRDKTISVLDIIRGQFMKPLEGHTSEIVSFSFSPDNQTMASCSMNEIKVWNIKDGRELKSFKGDGWPIYFINYSPDGKTLASDTANGVELWNVTTKKAVEFDESMVPPIRISINVGTGKTVAYYGLPTWAFDGSHGFTNINKALYRFEPDGAGLRLVNLNTRETVAEIVIDHFSHDWLVATPDGLFDGSPAAWNKIFWRFNNNTFDHAPVEAFYNEFYYPGLLQDIFAGKRPKAPSDISQKDRRQPQLKLALADAELGQTVTDRARKATVNIEVSELTADKDHKAGSGAQDVRLFRNGSLVKLWPGDLLGLKEKDGCRLQPQATPQSPRRSVCTATVPIVAGPNNFSAYAFNHDNIKSSDATLTVTGADSLKRKGTLHILAVGVSQYANREYNLNYTTDDATSFAAQVKLQQEKLARYESVNITTLLNENATKANILAELKKLTGSVQPEDGVVVYFSGHGKADGDHFYLVPHDLGYTGSRDQLSASDLQTVLKHSISDVELEEAFRDIDAGQMFMIIDACNSGQALENKDEPRRGPMNTRGLAQLAYEKGMYILTASQNVEEAFVSEKLKHSYLTYVLVEEGLKTKAADTDHNGEVNLREWFDYALARVPKLREETLQSKSLDEVNPTTRAAVRNQKSQTPRVFYRREADGRPMIVANVGASK